ncbi:MAG: hypothetical protein ACKO85_22180 [Isosphaeraceae bacterium]
MSIRIHCPQCDTVFEPPEGVWSAHCPFCGYESEVPHTHQDIDHGAFRKRFRRAPGWLVTLVAAMPPWGGPALVLSFFLLLASAFMQSWTAAHSDRSATAMSRALKSLESGKASGDNEKLLAGLDQVIAAWASESAETMALAAGLKKEAVKEQRKSLIQARWQKTLNLAAGQTGEKSLKLIEELEKEALGEPDLNSLAASATEAWAAARNRVVNQFRADFKFASESGQWQKAATALTSAVNLQTRARQSGQSQPALGDDLRVLVTQLARTHGVRINRSMIRTVFTDLPTASTRTLPTIQKQLADKGYIGMQSLSAEADKLFQEQSAYRLEVKFDETFGRPFEETPHRISIITIGMTFFKGPEQIWVQSATARTPRNPAQTAIGLSRIQLSKNTDERIERKFNEAAWETAPAALNQALQLVPVAR